MLFSYGQLGIGGAASQVVPIAVLTNGVLFGKNVTQVAAGAYHSLVLTSDGGVYSFGANS
jgi:alpha-tubulin suppressor-like RCC1 family protein